METSRFIGATDLMLSKLLMLPQQELLGSLAREPLGSVVMASPAEIERKVRQLDNDVQSVYELLATIEATQKRQGNRLAEIADTQANHGEKLDAILDLLRGNQSK